MSTEKLKEQVKNKFNKTFLKGSGREFASSLAYLCRMYWMQRPDKLNSGDYEIFRLLTNHYCILDEALFLNKDYKPSGRNDVMTFKLSHVELEEIICKAIVEMIK